MKIKKQIVRLCKFFFRVRKFRGNKNHIYAKNSAFLGCSFSFKGKHNDLVADDCFFYKCKFLFLGSNNKISIGSNCSFKYVTFWIEDDGNFIIIGNNCSFCGKAELACLEGTKIVIGDSLLCSSDVHFRTSDSHSILNLERKRINFAKDIIVGNHVWICQRTAILKGSVLPDNSVLAYGSVATKRFSTKNCIIGGVPAKIIKTDIDWMGER